MTVLNSKLIVSLVDQFTKPSKGLTATIGRLRAASEENAQRMSEMRGRMIDAVGAGYALYRGLSSPIAAAANFEEAMNKVGVVSRANQDQLTELTDAAREYGRTTVFTTTQVAEGMTFLAMAGLDANQVLASTGDMLNLAAAAGLDLSRSADLATNIMTGYGRTVEDLTEISDVLVGTFVRSNNDLNQLGDAFKYAGPIAAAAGMDFNETSAILGRLGDAGYQGSFGGTALRGALIRLLAPTGKAADLMNELEISIEDVAGDGGDLADALSDASGALQEIGLRVHDAEGRMLPFVDIMRQLEQHADDAGLMARLFGARAGPAMTALLRQGTGAVTDLKNELDALEGEALRVADARMQGFNGRMRAFWSAVEGVQIAIGNALIPSMTDMVNVATEAVAPITAMAERYPHVTRAVIGLTSALIAFRVASIGARYAALFMRGALIDLALASLTSARALGRLALWPVAAGFSALVNPIRLVTGALHLLKFALIGTGIGAALVAIGVAGAFIYTNWEGIRQMFAAFGRAFMEAISPILPALEPVTSAVAWLRDTVSGLLTPVDGLGQSWAAMGQSAGKAMGDLMVSAAELPGKIMASWSGASWIDIGDKIRQAFTSIDWLSIGSEMLVPLGTALAGVRDVVFSALQSIDWLGGISNAGTAIAGIYDVAAAALLSFDWSSAGVTIGTMVVAGLSSILSMPDTFFRALSFSGSGVDWAAIGGVIAAGILAFDWAKVGRSILDFIGAALKSGAQLIAGIVKGLFGIDLAAEGRALMNSLLDGIKAVMGKISSYIRNSLSSAISSVRGRASNLLNTVSGGYLGTSLDGARASGGPVRAGGTYLVGERGPELVTFPQAGFVHDALKTASVMRNASMASGIGGAALASALIVSPVAAAASAALFENPAKQLFLNGGSSAGERGPELITFPQAGFVHDALKTASVMRNASMASGIGGAAIASALTVAPAAGGPPASLLEVPVAQLLSEKGSSSAVGRTIEMNIAPGAITVQVTAMPGQAPEEIARHAVRLLSDELKRLQNGAFSD